jgi:hypothetical protein
VCRREAYFLKFFMDGTPCYLAEAQCQESRRDVQPSRNRIKRELFAALPAENA